jgi:hypothetical protein
MLGLGVSSASQLGGTAFALENSILAAFKTRVLADSGVVEDYACLNLDVKDLITEPAPFTTGLLEFYPGAAAAYSLRQLRRSVSPYAIRVRRSSDSQEQDIGFNSNGELDTNALLDFAGSGDAWVATWYDQSSNGNDATQGTNDYQPQIVASGSLITENGKPAVQFDGSDDFMTSGDYIVELSQNPASVFCVSQSNTLANSTYILTEGDVLSPYSSNFFLGSSDSILWVNTTTLGTMQTGQVLIGFDWDQTNATAFIDGSQSGVSKVVTANTETSLYSYIGSRADGIFAFFTGKIQELITYKSDQSANRQGIQTNINDFYSIYS